MADIIPVILCGGEGRRLWPLSTPEKPKPFHTFGGERSLFAEALLRCRSPIIAERLIVVAAERNEALVREELAAHDAVAELVLEPCGRNTCAAALAGAMQAMARDPEALVLVLAADQLIEPRAHFHDAVAAARSAAARDYIVTFGISPSHPAPDFGYVVPGAPLPGSLCFMANAFKEKPEAGQAISLMAEGALWNSGNFLVKASALREFTREFAPQVWENVAKAFAEAERIGDRVLLAAPALAAAPFLAIDVALLERARAVAVLPLSLAWRDLGNWDTAGARPGA